MLGRMKTLFFRILPVLCLCASATFSRAGDFKSVILTPANSSHAIHVPNDNFLVIRNFTQMGSTTPRGLITATVNGMPATILAAAFVNNMSPSIEVINNVIVAGPADVMVTCGATCFVSYRKGED
jgi:hypothetical protein